MLNKITRFEIIDQRPCPYCRGKGTRRLGEPCAACEGTGYKGREIVLLQSEHAVAHYNLQDDGHTLKVFIENDTPVPTD